MDKYYHYTKVSQTGRMLLREYNLHEKGVWTILGEVTDEWPYKYQLELGNYSGTLDEAIKYAVELRNFWTRGNGGDILKTSIANTEDVVKFMIKGVREKALAKLTNEEKRALGLE